MNMEKAQEVVLKIEAFYKEEKYTDQDGVVWLGIEGGTRDEDHWLREDTLVSISPTEMTKKMINDLMDWDEAPVGDPYEYAVQRVSPTKSYIIGDRWAGKQEQEDYLSDLTQLFPSDVKYKLVKRAKAGPVLDVDSEEGEDKDEQK